jgi:prophage regulatory protein
LPSCYTTNSRTPTVDTVRTKRINLMGAAELSERLGCSRQRAYQIARKSDFPKPYAKLKQGTVWAAEEVEAWMIAHGRIPPDDTEE